MKKRLMSNADLKQVDWAQCERSAMLRSLHSKRLTSVVGDTSSGWGCNVIDGDRRSVHAYLTGKGDLRATWWNLYSAIYLMVVPSGNLERSMYSFHRFHHAMTLAGLEFWQSVSNTAFDVQQDGVMEAARKTFIRDFNH